MADGLYPNRVREFRLALFLTRSQFAGICLQLAEANPEAYTPVSGRGLERIERGEVRPRVRSAATIAKALNLPPALVFPLGADDGVRNPHGNTRVPEGRPPRGKSKPKRNDAGNTL